MVIADRLASATRRTDAHRLVWDESAHATNIRVLHRICSKRLRSELALLAAVNSVA